MESLWKDCRYAARVLGRKPGFSLVAVLVLALGIGANTAIFTLTNSLLLRPIVAEEPDRLMALYSKDTSRPDSYRPFSYPNYVDIREDGTVFSSLLAHDLTVVGLREGDVTRRVFAQFASSNSFDTFGVRPSRGRFFHPAEEAPGSGIPVAVVGYEHWRRSGRDPDMVGSTLEVNGQRLEIVGIAPRHFTGRTALISPTLYLPLGMHQRLASDAFDSDERRLEDRDNHTLFLVGRLRPDLSPQEAEERLGTLAARLEQAFPAINDSQTIVLGPLSRLSVSTRPNDDDQLSLVAGLLLGMTGIVLLIACINLANMLLARSAARRKEFAIRTAIGGGRGRIVRQLLTEGLLLSLLGGAAGLLVASWANSLLAAWINRILALNSLGMDVVLRIAPDARVLLATAGFCVLATLLVGLGPAWKHSRPDVVEHLREQAGSTADRGRGLWDRGNLLVAGQLALSLVLLTAAGLFVRAAIEAANVDPGFSVQDGLLVEMDPGLAGYDEARSEQLYRRLLERLRAIPGIESAGLAATVPFGSVSSARTVRRAEDRPAASGDASREVETVAATSNIVGSGYFETLGVAVLRGRDFTSAETASDSGARVAIVDELLARRLWPGEDPLGRHITFGREPDPGEAEELRVVGVVSTLRDDLIPAELNPHVYVPYGQTLQSSMHIHLRTSSTDPQMKALLLQTVRREIRSVDEQLPILRLRTMEGHLAESPSLWLVRLGAALFGVFGILALALAVVGVYGVKSYTVALRTREIGIRQALGATARDAVRLIVGEGLVLTLAGLGVGLVLAVAMGRVLSGLLYEVSGLDPPAFLAAGAILAAASLLATYLPARRAASVDPASALREE